MNKQVNNSEPDSEIIQLNLNLPKETEDEGISFKEIISIFRKNIFKILVYTAIAFVLGIIVAVVYYFATIDYIGTASGIISFNYKGVEEGLDPDGRNLDVFKIKSAKVLFDAITELDLSQKGVTVEDLRANISIEGVVPQDAQQRILIIKEIATKDPSGLEKLVDLSYFSTQYVVSLKIPRELSFIDNAKAKELLDAILRSYQSYFYEEYGDRAVLDNVIGLLSYDTYDYSESVDIIKGQINNMVTYLVAKRTASPDFRSSATQMSFNDIITNLNLIKNVDLASLEATVTNRLLTKDRRKLISIYDYQITQKTLERQVQLEKARINQEAAISYQKDVAVMLSNGAGTTSDSPLFQFTQPSETYDRLVTAAAEASSMATQLQSDIDYYQSRIDELQNPANVSNNPADIAAAEESLTLITDKLKNWIDITNKTVDEYVEAEFLKDSTKIILASQYINSLMGNIKMILIIVVGVAFVGFIVGTIASYGKSLLR